MQTGQNQHILPHNEGWQIKGDIHAKPTQVTGTRDEAIAVAKEIAREENSEVIVYEKNGAIKDREFFGKYPPEAEA